MPSPYISLLLFLVLGIALPNKVIATPSLEPKQKLVTLLNNINIINADFTQTVTNKSGKIIQQQTGTVQLKKPYLLNWQILSPDQLQIVIDGKKVWHYDIDLEQVMVKELDTVTNSGSKIADLLLGDLQQSLDNFTINQVQANCALS
jgi:outer membrane lipoprotein carrier protein